MAESHDALQAQFVELTGADAATAHFYLESSGWKLDVRLPRPLSVVFLGRRST